MAEYFPLLERAVSGLKESSPEARRAIYERARTALLGQLRSIDPPVPAEDVDREAVALDEAIQRLEARFKTSASPAVGPPAVTPPVIAPPPRPSTPAVTPPARERPVFTPRPPGSAAGAAEARPSATAVRPKLGIDPDRARAVPPPSRPSPTPRPSAASLRPRAVAPVAGESPSGPPAVEPVPTDDETPRGSTTALPSVTKLEISDRIEPRSGGGAIDDAGDPAARSRPGIRPSAPGPAESRPRGKAFYAVLSVLLLVTAGVAVTAYRLRDQASQVTASKATPIVSAPDGPNKIVGRAGGTDAGTSDQPTGSASGGPASPPDAAAETSPPSASDQPGKTSEPLPAAPASPAATGSADTPAIGVSQRAALLVDAPEDPQKVKTYEGSVVWSEENVSAGQDQPLSTAVRAELDIPEAKLAMSMILKKNTEPQLPASYTLEFQFMPKAGNTLGAIKQINVPEMRQNDAALTGDPLAGLSASITEDHFLVGLAQGDARATNTALLLQRNWIDLSILFASGKVGKVTFEKGATGQRIIEDAMKSWQ